MPAKSAAAGKGRQQPQTKRRRTKFNAERETIKFLLFTQTVLFFAGGALPGHFRLVTLLPLGVLLGAGAFRLLGAGLSLLEAHNRRVAAQPEPARRSQPAPQPTAVPPKVVATRVA